MGIRSSSRGGVGVGAVGGGGGGGGGGAEEGKGKQGARLHIYKGLWESVQNLRDNYEEKGSFYSACVHPSRCFARPKPY